MRPKRWKRKTRRKERAGKAGEEEGVFWGGLVACCKARTKDERKEQ